jgi:energy-coupling factor transporter ATP-binding protein EcfA2/energy-coupling factor transporter transmembrane protein EcfT
MIRAVSAGYRFPSGRVIGPVDLAVARGELVLLAGPSGSGKSTVSRLLAGISGVHGGGTAFGAVSVGGLDPAGCSPGERAARVAFVPQEIDDAWLTQTIGEELAFSLDQRGASSAVVATEVEAWRERFQLPPASRSIAELSTGQRQRLAIAAALSAGAQALILDEPLAHLDPAAAVRVAADLADLADSGVAVLVVEHRLRPFWERCTRIVVLEAGRVTADAAPNEAIASLRTLGLAWPGAAVADPVPPAPLGATLLQLPRVERRLPSGFSLVVDELVFRAGERVAVVGGNGAGKSTFIDVLRDAQAHGGGVRGRFLDVPADPDLALFCPTVRDEIAWGAPQAPADEIRSWAHRFSLRPELDTPPQALSRGQRLRAALAAAVAVQPSVLALDEPTAGQDPVQVERALEALVDAQAAGVLVFATHDPAVALRYATRVLRLDAGRIVADGLPSLVLNAEPAPSGDPWSGATEQRPPRALDPRSGLGLLVATGVLAVTLENVLPLLMLAAAATLAAISSASVRRSGRRGLAVVGAILWANLVAQGLFYADAPRTAAFAWGPLVVWREGLVHGMVQTLRFVAVAASGAAVVARVPPHRWVMGLSAAGIPFGLSFLSGVAAQFVPNVVREVGIVDAARRRRAPQKGGSPGVIRMVSVVWRAVAVRTVRRARVFAEAMDSRGVDPVGGRASALPRWPLPERLGVAMVLVFTAIFLVGKLVFSAYALDVWWNPRWAAFYAAWRQFG